MMMLSKRLWDLSLFQLHGSVVFLGLPFSLASSALTLLLHSLLRDRLAQELSGLYLFHVFAVVLGFLVVFRLQLSYNRFWEGRSHLHVWGTKLADAVAQALTFDAQLLSSPPGDSAPLPPPNLPPPASQLHPSSAALPDDSGSRAKPPRPQAHVPTPSQQQRGGIPVSQSTAQSSLPRSLQRQLSERQGSDRLPDSSLYWQPQHQTVHEERASAVSEALESHSMDHSIVHNAAPRLGGEEEEPVSRFSRGTNRLVQSSGGARIVDRRVSGLGGSSASTSWTPPSAMVRSSLHHSSVAHSLTTSAAFDIAPAVTQAPAAADSTPSSVAAPAVFVGTAPLDPADSGAAAAAAAAASRGSAGAAINGGTAAALALGTTASRRDSEGAGGGGSTVAVREHRHFADTMLHLGSLLHAVGLSSLQGDYNMSHITVHSSERGRVSGSNLEQHAPMVPPRSQAYHNPPSHNHPHPPCHWATPQPVAESDMHSPHRNASYIPPDISPPFSGAPGASYTPTSALHTPVGTPNKSGPRRASSYSTLPTHFGSQTHLNQLHRQSAVSVVPTVASGIFFDDISAHGHAYAQQMLAEQTPAILLPRGHSTQFLGALPGVHGGSSSGLEVPASDRYTDMSNTMSPHSIRKSRGEKASCWKQLVSCCEAFGCLSLVPGGRRQREGGKQDGAGRYRDADGRDQKLPVIGGLTQDEGNALGAFATEQNSNSLNVSVQGFLQDGMHAPSPQERAQVVHMWMQQALLLRLVGGGLAVPASIQAHVVRLLTEAMQSYEHCKKIVDTPFPFPWSQATSLMILAMTVLVPFLSTAFSASRVFAVLSSFLLIHLLVTLHELAAALEDPFRDGPTQPGFMLLQKRFNARVLATVFAERPVSFTDLSAIVGPGHMPAMHGRNASEGGKGAPPVTALPDSDDAKNQLFSSEGKEPKLHHVLVQASDRSSLDEASLREASIQKHSEMSRSSSSVFRKVSEASGSLDRTMHEALQFGFDEDDGVVGGDREATSVPPYTATSGFGANAFQSASGVVMHMGGSDQERQRRQSQLFDSGTIVSYSVGDSPVQQQQQQHHHRSSMHGSHTLDVVYSAPRGTTPHPPTPSTHRYTSTLPQQVEASQSSHRTLQQSPSDHAQSADSPVVFISNTSRTQQQIPSTHTPLEPLVASPTTGQSLPRSVAVNTGPPGVYPVPRSPLGSTPPGTAALPASLSLITDTIPDSSHITQAPNPLDRAGTGGFATNRASGCLQQQGSSTSVLQTAQRNRLPGARRRSVGVEAYNAPEQHPPCEIETEVPQFPNLEQRRSSDMPSFTDDPTPSRMHLAQAASAAQDTPVATDVEVSDSMQGEHALSHACGTVSRYRLTAALIATNMRAAASTLPHFDFNPPPTSSSQSQSSVAESVRDRDTPVATGAPLQQAGLGVGPVELSSWAHVPQTHAPPMHTHPMHAFEAYAPHGYPSESHQVGSLELPGLPCASETARAVSEVRSGAPQNLPEDSASRSPLSIALEARVASSTWQGAAIGTNDVSQTPVATLPHARMHAPVEGNSQGGHGLGRSRPVTVATAQSTAGAAAATAAATASLGVLAGQRMSRREAGASPLVARRAEETGETMSLSGSVELPAVQHFPRARGSIYGRYIDEEQ